MSLNYGGFESVGCVESSADQPDRNDWTWLVECTVCFALVRSVSSHEHMKWHEEERHLRA